MFFFLRAQVLLAALVGFAAAHSALTIPQPRNAIDSDEQPWGGPVPHPLPFQPWCPIPSRSAVNKDDRNLTGSNGQACFWFSNGCAIGCEACDGSTRGPIPSFDCTRTRCVPTGDPIKFGACLFVAQYHEIMRSTGCLFIGAFCGGLYCAANRYFLTLFLAQARKRQCVAQAQ